MPATTRFLFSFFQVNLVTTSKKIKKHSVLKRLAMEKHTSHYLAQTLIFGVVVTPLFVFIYYQLFKYRNHIYFQKRRPLFTLIICISLYSLAVAETFLSPQYTLLFEKQLIVAKFIYYTTTIASANAFAIAALARYDRIFPYS